MENLSILNNKQTILKPNSEFERRRIFQYYLENDIKLTEQEREILNKCVAVEPESIGIIGCLLNDKSHLNTLRLAIGSKNKSNLKLTNLSKQLFTNKFLQKAENYYMIDKDFNDLSDVELDVDKVYNEIYFQ